jgi:DNA-binding response OmpR family regulator
VSDRLAGVRVLIVDDDQDILKSIDLAMRGEGARTLTVSDGNAAIHAAQNDKPDLVVLDMMLPMFSGLFVLEKIKAMDDAPLVIMVTANEGKRHMAYAETFGVDAYLYKPVPLQRLVDRAAELIEARRAAKDA